MIMRIDIPGSSFVKITLVMSILSVASGCSRSKQLDRRGTPQPVLSSKIGYCGNDSDERRIQLLRTSLDKLSRELMTEVERYDNPNLTVEERYDVDVEIRWLIGSLRTWEELHQKFIAANASKNAEPNVLFRAVLADEPRVVLDLISRGTNLEFRDEHGSTLLYFVGFMSDSNPPWIEVMDALVKRGADVNARCIGGATPLFGACEGGSREVVHYLISKGANINAKDDTDVTPFHVATSNQGAATEVMKVLLDAGADINAKTKNGLTPLDFAKQIDRRAEVIQWLIDHGARSGSEES